MNAPIETLLEIVRRYGTPAYAYDLACLRRQVEKLRSHLPPEIHFLYSLKANPSLGLCSFFASQDLGADVASAGELATVIEAGFAPARVFVGGPDKSREMLEILDTVPEAVVSVDSASELELLSSRPSSVSPQIRSIVLRLRPDFSSHAVVTAGADSRFGIPLEDIAQCRDWISSPHAQVIGFHVFSGSQVLEATGINRHMRGALDLSLRAADELAFTPEFINLGGGFGIPYGADDRELDLNCIAEELRSLLPRARPARIVLELGRFLVAQSGWYLTQVIAHQTHRGREAVVVDGGTHQRADLCGLGLRNQALPPLALTAEKNPSRPTDILGCLSLPADILAESCPLPPLHAGDVLAFANAGAYGLGASPNAFHAHVPPAEVAFEDDRVEVIRERSPAHAVLAGQKRLHALNHL